MQVEDVGGWEGCRWRMWEGVGEGARGGCGRKGGWEGVHVIVEKCLRVIHLPPPHTVLAQGRPGGSSGGVDSHQAGLLCTKDEAKIHNWFL